MILLLWGAGGHAKVVLDIVRAAYEFSDIRFLDDAPEKQGSTFCGSPVLGGSQCLPLFNGAERFLISIGDNQIRARRYRAAIQEGLTAVTLVHPSSVVSPAASIGEGTVVMAGAVINAGARVGRDCIINSGAIVEHDCVIGDHAHVAPGAVLGGSVGVGEFALVGIGARVLPGAEIGAGAIVGAGAVVLHCAPPHTTSAGVPATIVRKGFRNPGARENRSLPQPPMLPAGRKDVRPPGSAH